MRIKPTRGVDYVLMHWSFVGFGAPWQHASHWNPPSEPTPAKPDRIAALGWFEAELSPSAALAALEYMQLLDRMTLARANATPLQHESLRDRPMT